MQHDKKAAKIKFAFPRIEKPIPFEVSIKAAKSQRVAERVAVLCFLKLQENQDFKVKDLECFRDDILSGYTGGEDVPNDHESWDLCRSQITDLNPTCAFNFEDATGKKLHFQTTRAAAGNSILQAERIARLCYLQLESGMPKLEVIEYRNKLYQAINPTLKPRKPEVSPRQKRKVVAREEPPSGKRAKAHHASMGS